ncbi:MAG: NAD(+) diphosphatase [Robiginitomaculum sp.]
MTQDFTIAFTGGPFDHAETGRSPQQVQKLVEDKRAQTVLLHKGAPAIDAKGQLIRIHPSALIGMDIYDPGPIYLGQDGDVPLFAANMARPEQSGGGAFTDLREAARLMSGADLAIAGRARSLLDWHFNHGFCAKCGKKTDARDGGLKRLCTFCNTEHFPRVNPVAIMLVVHGDEVLLGRSAGWPEGFFSALAGFASPGESLEETCRREVWEEAGIITTDHRYIMSQPWPFPSQLMLGMICTAQSKTLNINTDEIEDARWFSKDAVRGVYAKTDDSFKRPPRFALADQLLRWWIAQD